MHFIDAPPLIGWELNGKEWRLFDDILVEIAQLIDGCESDAPVAPRRAEGFGQVALWSGEHTDATVTELHQADVLHVHRSDCDGVEGLQIGRGLENSVVIEAFCSTGLGSGFDATNNEL